MTLNKRRMNSVRSAFYSMRSSQIKMKRRDGTKVSMNGFSSHGGALEEMTLQVILEKWEEA